MTRALLVFLLVALPFGACQNRPQPASDGIRIEVLPLDFADLDEMVAVLEDFAVQDDTGLKIVGDQRTNSVIVSGTVTQLDQVRELIAQLDVESK